MSDEDTELRICQFAFRCTRAWDSLQKTEAEAVRYCDDCERNVYFCKSDLELSAAIQKNRCVAVVLRSETESYDSAEEFEMVMGEPKYPSKVDV